MRATLLYEIAAGQLELIALDAGPDGDPARAEALRRRLVAKIHEVAGQVSYRRRTRFRR